jgi:hypothetical protein
MLLHLRDGQSLYKRSFVGAHELNEVGIHHLEQLRDGYRSFEDFSLMDIIDMSGFTLQPPHPLNDLQISSAKQAHEVEAAARASEHVAIERYKDFFRAEQEAAARRSAARYKTQYSGPYSYHREPPPESNAWGFVILAAVLCGICFYFWPRKR